MRKGILAGGIILLVLGFLVFVYPIGTNAESVMTVTIYCDSGRGVLAQAFSVDIQQFCNYLYLISAILAVMMIIGIVLIIVGSVKGGKQKTV